MSLLLFTSLVFLTSVLAGLLILIANPVARVDLCVVVACPQMCRVPSCGLNCIQYV